jgi:putative ABC transport system permease protein
MSPIALGRLVVEALWDERRRVGLAALGIVIGVTSIVLLISIGTGARTYVQDQFGSIGANVLIVIPGHVETTGAIPGSFMGVPHPLTIEDARAIKQKVRSVREIAPLTIGTSHVSFDARSRDCMVIGTTAEFEAVRDHHAALGKFLPPDGQASRGDRMCALGDTVARELFRGENPLGKTVRIGSSRFRVHAVMEPKGRQQGFDLDELVFVAEPVARRMFNMRGLSRILVKTAKGDDEEKTSFDIVSLLRERHRVIDFTVLTPGSILSSLETVVSILTGMLAGIAAVSLVVGGIGIANTALVATSARTSEVGLKKALGAAPGWILAQFVLESSLLGAAGGGAGALLAAAICVVARHFLGDSLPLETPLWSIGLAIGACSLVGLAAGAIPAAHAARLDPVAALRSGGGGSK